MSLPSEEHVLTIVADDAHGDWSWSIFCPYEPDQFGAESRPCVVSVECDCHLSPQEEDELHSNGEGPCSKAPNGMHRPLPHSVGYDIPRCWAKVCDDTCDQVADIRREHGAGVYRISVIGSWETVEFEVLARADAAKGKP